MIKIGICDDERTITGQIETMILELCEKEGIMVDIDVFESGLELEKELLLGGKYDLLYLDIQMDKGNGIETARNIRKMDENVLLIFVSGYDKYLMELFQWDVFDFIKKPINTEIFIKTFLRANEKICIKKVYFTYRYKSEEYKVLSSEIYYFESRGRKIVVHLKSGEAEEFNGKLNDVENNLKSGKIPFLRIHQSYLVNFLFIKSRLKAEITLTNGIKFPISEERQKAFDQNYGKLLGGEIDE